MSENLLKKLKKIIKIKIFFVTFHYFFRRTLQLFLHVIPRSNPTTKNLNPDHNNTNKQKKRRKN